MYGPFLYIFGALRGNLRVLREGCFGLPREAAEVHSRTHRHPDMPSGHASVPGSGTPRDPRGAGAGYVVFWALTYIHGIGFPVDFDFAAVIRVRHGTWFLAGLRCWCLAHQGSKLPG